MNAKLEAMHAIKTNLEGNARHENKTLKVTHAMKTNLGDTHHEYKVGGDTRHEYKVGGDTRHENEPRRRHTP